MRKLILLVLFLSCCSSNKPVKPPERTLPVKGYDVLGLPKYCEMLLNAPPLPTVSILLESFGDPMPCVEQYINKNSAIVTDIQVDLVDATCHRNKVCPPGTPALNNMAVMKERADRINNYAKKYNKIIWWISPYLEHDIKNVSELQKAFDVVKTSCPTCRPINSPVSGASIAGIPNELHGTKVSAFSVSGDGASAFDGDNIKNDGNNFQHRISGSETTYGWVNSFNLRCTGEKKFIAINKRTHKPTADEFLQLNKILTTEEDPRPNPPSQCRTNREVQGKEILKSNAELYCNGTPDDGRGNKPLLIINKKGRWQEKMPILNASGQEVACFKYYGSYSVAGLYRWYVGSCSGQTPYQLYLNLGGEWGFAKDSLGNCIRFNAIRRQGIYR